jgi:hypothetical protein
MGGGNGEVGVPGCLWMGGKIGISGNQMPPPGLPGVAGVEGGKIGTEGVSVSGGGGSSGISMGSRGNEYAITGTSTGVSRIFSVGSFGRLGSMAIGE